MRLVLRICMYLLPVVITTLQLSSLVVAQLMTISCTRWFADSKWDKQDI